MIIKKVKNSSQMVRQIPQDLSLISVFSYINIMVGGVDCALVAKWLRHSPNKRGPPRTSGFDSRPGRTQFLNKQECQKNK